MPRNQREKEEEKSQIKLSPKQVPGSVGEAIVCYVLAQAAQVVVDPRIFPVLERLYDAEVSSGDTNPNNEVRAELTRIHEQLYDAVAAAGFEMCDLCEAVSRCSAGGSGNSIAREVRDCARARTQMWNAQRPGDVQRRARCGERSLIQPTHQEKIQTMKPSRSEIDAVDEGSRERTNKPSAVVLVDGTVDFVAR